MMKHEILDRAREIVSAADRDSSILDRVETTDRMLRQFHNEILNEAFVVLLRSNLERSAKLVERLKIDEL
jgi:hypothetical protein